MLKCLYVYIEYKYNDIIVYIPKSALVRVEK